MAANNRSQQYIPITDFFNTHFPITLTDPDRPILNECKGRAGAALFQLSRLPLNLLVQLCHEVIS
jgi:hypothetical protein